MQMHKEYLNNSRGSDEKSALMLDLEKMIDNPEDGEKDKDFKVPRLSE